MNVPLWLGIAAVVVTVVAVAVEVAGRSRG